jgi:hypothetical protein
MSKQIMIVKPGELSSKDKEKLSKNGYMVIEHPEPDTVRIIQPFDGQVADDIGMAALFAVARYTETSDRPAAFFVKEFLRRLLENEKTNQP